MKKSHFFTILLFVLLAVQVAFGSTYQPKMTNTVAKALNFSVQQYKLMVAGLKDSTIIPRRTISATNFGLYTVGPTDWTSGFFAGTLWYLYEFSGDPYWRDKSLKWTNYLLPMKSNTQLQHDIGFVMNSSFGNAYRLTGNPANIPTITESGITLSKRFLPVVGCFKSWDSGKWAKPSVNIGSWNFPVIIDNMMNLELQMKTFLLTKDSTYYNQACSHANTTLLNHIRPDSSMYHVIDYYKYNGKVILKGTRQGFSDMSCWSRGQAWGIYGFTMMYKYTKNPIYLQTAKKLFGYYLKHIPADYIPFWDYKDPTIPNTSKDASAAAITSSALIDLYQMTNDSSFLKHAENIIKSLSSSAYTNSLGTKANFILSHSTGGSNGYEVDVSQTYADYYYVETLVKYLHLDANYKFANHYPEINTEKLTSACLDKNYSLQLDLFDFDGDILTVSYDGLPKGLTVNNSGLISGIPTQAGVFKVNLKVSDGKQQIIATRELSVLTSTNLHRIVDENLISIYLENNSNRLTIKLNKESTSKNLTANIYSSSGQLIVSESLSFYQNISHIILPDYSSHKFLIIELLDNKRTVAHKKFIPVF
jgi:hypothetical protein